MKSMILASAAALALLTLPSQISAQDNGGYFDPGDGSDVDPNKDWNSDCNYNVLCDPFIERPDDPPSDDSSDKGGWLDGIKDGWDSIGDWYDEKKAERERERQEEIARKQREEEKRLSDLKWMFGDNPEVGDAILAYRDQESGLWQQAHRLLGGKGEFTFSGGGMNEEGALTYSGTFKQGYIYGSYSLTDFEDNETYGGGFAGAVTRFGRVTGAYVNPEEKEKGNFTGTVSPGLDKVFSGGFSCTQNCDSDE